eukprot:2564404-Prymnesium_polylepis.1
MGARAVEVQNYLRIGSRHRAGRAVGSRRAGRAVGSGGVAVGRRAFEPLPDATHVLDDCAALDTLGPRRDEAPLVELVVRRVALEAMCLMHREQQPRPAHDADQHRIVLVIRVEALWLVTAINHWVKRTAHGGGEVG